MVSIKEGCVHRGEPNPYSYKLYHMSLLLIVLPPSSHQAVHDTQTPTKAATLYLSLPAIKLHEELMNPANIHNFGSVDRLMLGLVFEMAQTRDVYMTNELTRHLFQTPGESSCS